MEDTLRVENQVARNNYKTVLILVLMEDTLRVYLKVVSMWVLRLNPCFNGRYSQSREVHSYNYSRRGLNPCFNGRYSQRNKKKFGSKIQKVLILVLMEDTLRVTRKPRKVGLS